MKYVLHPGYINYGVRVKRFVPFMELVELYKLPLNVCYNAARASDMAGLRKAECIHLYPREDGNYNLPGETR
jgi:hypothetical protein